MEHPSHLNQIYRRDHQNQNYMSEQGPFSIQQNLLEELQYQGNVDVWTPKQNAKYAAFIMKHSEMMQNKGHNKLWSLYKKMSKFIQSRNFRQCKSHHQKMLEKHKNASQIIAQVKKDNPFFEKMLTSQSLLLSFGNSRRESPGNKLDYSRILEEVGSSERTKKTSSTYRGQQTTIKGEKEMSEFLHSEWMLCHQLFLQWTKRLNEIMIQGPKY